MPCHEKAAPHATESVTRSRRSTGPKTPQGKSRSSKNALRFGLYSRHLIVCTKWFDESATDFRELLRSLLEEFPATTATERFLVEAFATTHWLLARVQRARQLVMEDCGYKDVAEHISPTALMLAKTVYRKNVMFKLASEDVARQTYNDMIRRAEIADPAVRVETPQHRADALVQLMANLEFFDRREAHLWRQFWRLYEELHRIFSPPRKRKSPQVLRSRVDDGQR